MPRDSWSTENGLHGGELCVFLFGLVLLSYFFKFAYLDFHFSGFFFFREREIKRETEKKSMKMGGEGLGKELGRFWEELVER